MGRQDNSHIKAAYFTVLQSVCNCSVSVDGPQPEPTDRQTDNILHNLKSLSAMHDNYYSHILFCCIQDGTPLTTH